MEINQEIGEFFPFFLAFYPLYVGYFIASCKDSSLAFYISMP